jgi:hypothetical protein
MCSTIIKLNNEEFVSEYTQNSFNFVKDYITTTPKISNIYLFFGCDLEFFKSSILLNDKKILFKDLNIDLDENIFLMNGKKIECDKYFFNILSSSQTVKLTKLILILNKIKYYYYGHFNDKTMLKILSITKDTKIVKEKVLFYNFLLKSNVIYFFYQTKK